MTPPDEVLRKMAEAAGYAEFIMCDAATCNGMCEAPEVHFAPAIQRALTAAEKAGWALVPVEADEVMIEAGCGIDCTRTVCRARLECRDASGQATMREKWSAMLAAAPKVGGE